MLRPFKPVKILEHFMRDTKIEWAELVWNPAWGCHNHCKTPYGREYCYAKDFARRFGKTECEKSFQPAWKEDSFCKRIPYPRITRNIFVNSMSDIAYWEPEWMQKVLEKIREYPDLQFIFLTKNGWLPYHGLSFPKNVIAGITVTCQEDYDRIMDEECFNEFANSVPSGALPRKYLLNIEPMFGPVKFRWFEWDWIIAGAETGGKKDKRIQVKPEWLLQALACAKLINAPFFMKPSLSYVYDGPLVQQRLIYLREERKL